MKAVISMPLPACDDEAGMLALEPKCASPSSSESRRTVLELSGLPAEHKSGYFWNAVIDGLSNLVRCALEAKFSPNTRSGSALDRPVLVEAALRGHARIVKQLLEAGADHNLPDSLGITALNAAAQNGRLDCVQLLLAAGADASKPESALGLTPLLTGRCSPFPICCSPAARE